MKIEKAKVKDIIYCVLYKSSENSIDNRSF